MIKKDQIFELKLEDYSRPRYMSAIKPYYGTMDDMIEFMIRLEDNPNTCTRYQETLDAAEYYDLDNDLPHTVAGQTLSIFVPVTEISRLETTCQDVRWEYTAYSGSVYPCYASKIEMCQSLMETKSGYELCLRANITGLQVCYPGIGWICHNGITKGFPGMVTFADNTYQMSLAASQAHYEFNEYHLAMEDAVNPNSVNLACLVADILAEG